jgi:hypothetical protein
MSARADADRESRFNALKAQGITFANAMAGVLNARGYATARGGR